MPTAQPRTSPSDPGAAVGRRACLRSWPCGRLLQVLMVAEPVVTILLLRLMCSPGVVRRAGGPSAARPQPVPAAGPPAAGAGPFLPGRADQPGPVRTGRVALSLGLPAAYFAGGYTADPTVLFRIFSYPPSPPGFSGWGVGEHTDYGLLTLLAQDDSGGLQIAAPQGWTGSCSNRTSSLSATQPPPNRTRMRGRSGALNGSRSGSGLATGGRPIASCASGPCRREEEAGERQLTVTTILPAAWPSSMTRCAWTISSKPNTRTGLAL